ncbi:MAG: hypothetical protein HC917_25090 [Richelia sp. SM2_1_7]|nr:hypothetical protein [Richelia sp. SM2_1_7]
MFWRIGITGAIVGFVGEMGFSKRVDLLNVRSGDVYDGLRREPQLNNLETVHCANTTTQPQKILPTA